MSTKQPCPPAPEVEPPAPEVEPTASGDEPTAPEVEAPFAVGDHGAGMPPLSPGYMVGIAAGVETPAQHGARLGVKAGTPTDAGWLMGTVRPAADVYPPSPLTIATMTPSVFLSSDSIESVTVTGNGFLAGTTFETGDGGGVGTLVLVSPASATMTISPIVLGVGTHHLQAFRDGLESELFYFVIEAP